jgi:hypothetical protein
MMSDGMPLVGWLGARHLLKNIAAFEQALEANPRCLVSDFERYGLVFPDTPQFEFAVREDEAGVIETKTGAWMSLIGNLHS